MIGIKNDCISLSLDKQGRLVELQNIKTGRGNVIARPVSLFRAILRIGKNYEEIALGDHAEVTVSASDNRALIHVTRLHTRKHTAEVEMNLTISLDGEKVLFDSEIINHDQVTVMDFFFPCIGAIQSLGCGKPDLLFPAGFGEYHKDIVSELMHTGGRDTAMLLSGIYPFTMSMQYMLLTDGNQCLYLASQDSEFHIHSMLAAGSEHGDVTLEFDKMIFVDPGKTWKSDQQVLWLYQGAWQKGAEAYRRWADSWRKPIAPPAWIQESNGCLKAITKQGYGAETYPYDKIPYLHQIAQAHGCDDITLYNALWTDHRGLNGPLEAIDSMGGEEALKTNIEKVHEQGGHVTLHYNGHKMEVTSPFYETVGQAMASRNHWGNPFFEQYNCAAASDYIQWFGLKTAVAMCPGCKEWQDALLHKSEQLKSAGVDGVIFEEVGGLQRYVHATLCTPKPSPCFNPDHHHESPTTAYTQGRREMLSRLHEAAQKESSAFALMSETLSDLFSQYTDCVYGLSSHSSASERDSAHKGGSQPGQKGERAAFIQNTGDRTINMPELFRHTFPEVIATLSNKQPSLTKRQVNYALCYGFRFELSLYTMLDKQFIENDPHPEWRAYARAVGALRKKYADLLLKGTYSCDTAFAQANPALHHGVFSSETQECLVLWNDTDQILPIILGSQQVTRWEMVDDKGEGAPDAIAPDSIMVLFLG